LIAPIFRLLCCDWHVFIIYSYSSINALVVWLSFKTITLLKMLKSNLRNRGAIRALKPGRTIPQQIQD
jgi:hypothetical protein